MKYLQERDDGLSNWTNPSYHGQVKTQSKSKCGDHLQLKTRIMAIFGVTCGQHAIYRCDLRYKALQLLILALLFPSIEPLLVSQLKISAIACLATEERQEIKVVAH